jgi:hypothetical protein
VTGNFTDGVFTMTIDPATFNSASSTKWVSESVSSTDWYKNEMDAAYKAAVDKCVVSLSGDTVTVEVPAGTW